MRCTYEDVYEMEIGLITLAGVVVFMTAGMMAIATVNFEKMETV